MAFGMVSLEKRLSNNIKKISEDCIKEVIKYLSKITPAGKPPRACVHCLSVADAIYSVGKLDIRPTTDITFVKVFFSY